MGDLYDLDDVNEDLPAGNIANSAPENKSSWGNPPASRPAAAGWGEPTPTSDAAASDSGARFGRRQGGIGDVSERKQPDRLDIIADITEIPALDGEEEKDDITDKIAHAPNVRAQRVQALSDLDEGVSRLTGTVDGIDLSLLTSVLTPLEKLGRGAEQDAMWDFDSLFAELASEMQREMDGDREEDPDDFQFGLAADQKEYSVSRAVTRA